MSNADPCVTSTCKWPKDNGVVQVPIRFESTFSAAQKKFIQEALQTFESETCVRFVPHTPRHINYLHVISGEGCWSYVGLQGGEQQVSLQAEYCLKIPVVQHEFLHALGFEHEHSRSDRDQNILINWANVAPGAEPNFDVIQTNNLQTDYDFTSVLQYGPTAFSVNSLSTITPLNSSISTFGNAASMSPNDILRVKSLYQC